jgi:ribonuclease BN (tRNA processing enzyme)
MLPDVEMRAANGTAAPSRARLATAPTARDYAVREAAWRDAAVPALSVTVLGASPAWANPGGACAGYLVRSGPDNVLLDCGSGTLGRLRCCLALDDLAAVCISHLHADHFIDLISLRYGLKYGGLRADPHLPLFAPPGAGEFFAGLGRALDGDPHFFDGTFELIEYRPGERTELGQLSLEFRAVKHYIPAYGLAIENERRLVYSGDAAPSPALADLARGADLFLCEAAITSPSQDDPNPANRGHLTALEAATLAREAGVARLLLTHYRANPECAPALARAATLAFGRPVEFACEGQEYQV